MICDEAGDLVVAFAGYPRGSTTATPGTGTRPPNCVVPGVEPLHPNLPAPVAVRGNVLETAGGDLLITAHSI